MKISGLQLDFSVNRELGNPIFEHYIGSELINSRTEGSDYDILKIYTDKLIINDNFLIGFLPSLDWSINKMSFDTNNEICIDYKHMSMYALISGLLDTKDDFIVNLSWIVSHLYAIKFNIIKYIYNEDLFALYKKWLMVPGNSRNFWNKCRNQFYLELICLPDKTFNWSQMFNGSTEHISAKENWDKLNTLGILRYPTVEKVGYDPIATKRVFAHLIICTCILNDRLISNSESSVLMKIKNHEIKFDEYLQLKKYIWSEFRKATESINAVYFLGKGLSMEESLDSTLYGIYGITNLVRNTTTLTYNKVDT